MCPECDYAHALIAQARIDTEIMLRGADAQIRHKEQELANALEEIQTLRERLEIFGVGGLSGGIGDEEDGQ